MEKIGLGNGCPLYKKCGGCQLQNMTYQDQLHFKQAKVITLLGKYCHVNEIIGMSNPSHYRCKVQAAFGHRNGKIISGVFQSSTHNIIPVDNCLIEDEGADSIIVSIRKLMEQFKIKSFDDRNMTGFIRHVLVRKGYNTNQYMVVIVTSSSNFPSKAAFIKSLLSQHPEITTIVQNINNKFTSLVLGNTNITLFGNGNITDKLCGCEFTISPSSFYQVNPQMTEVLYSTAINGLNLTNKEKLIDAYCGTGTLGIIASKKCEEVIGIELNGDAIKDANKNSQLNNINNIQFVKGDSTDILKQMASDKEYFDALIMDPPRAGSTKTFIDAVSFLSPKKVAYISCNPETLSRDLYYFAKNNYKVKKIQPVDMFPHTNHVECVALLSKIK